MQCVTWILDSCVAERQLLTCVRHAYLRSLDLGILNLDRFTVYIMLVFCLIARWQRLGARLNCDPTFVTPQSSVLFHFLLTIKLALLLHLELISISLFFLLLLLDSIECIFFSNCLCLLLGDQS